MKKTILFLLTLISINTFACPDLAGKYNCQEAEYDGINYQYQIRQDGSHFLINSNIQKEEEFHADGISRNSLNELYNISSQCKTDSLDINIDSIIDLHNDASIRTNSKITIRLSDEGINILEQSTAFGKKTSIITHCQRI